MRAKQTDGRINPSSSVPWALADTRVVLLLLALFAGMVLAIKPQGEFPLNDDWAYILPVEWLVKQGKLHFTDWQFMTLIGQVYLGAATATAFGFSITGLRLLVLSLAALSVVLVYAISRLAGAARPWALIAAGLLFCNPIFLVTSASFMTDTPFLAISLLAIFCLLLWQKESNVFCGVVAWLLVLYACSIRQSAIALAVGFSLFCAFQHGVTRKLLLTCLLPTGLAAGGLAAYPMLIDHSIGLPSMYNQPTLEAKAFVVGLLHFKLGYLWMATKTALVALYYLGLCTIPLLPLTFYINCTSPTRRWPSGSTIKIAVSGIITLILIGAGRVTPFDGNTLFDFGLGIRTLPGAGPITTAAPAVWWAVTFLSVLSLLSLKGIAAALFSQLRQKTPAHQSQRFVKSYAIMLMGILAVYNLPFLTRGGIWFDRYATPNLSFFVLLAIPFTARRPILPGRMAVSVLLMAGFIGFSVVAIHDYLEWNRQRWAAATELADTYGVGFDQIDGGFEYNNYMPRRSKDIRRPPEQVLLANPDARYRVAFTELPGHEVLKIIECRTWLYGSPSAIFLLRADTAPPAR